MSDSVIQKIKRMPFLRHTACSYGVHCNVRAPRTIIRMICVSAFSML